MEPSDRSALARPRGWALRAAGAAAQGPRDTACEAVNGTSCLPAMRRHLQTGHGHRRPARALQHAQDQHLSGGLGLALHRVAEIEVEGGKGVVEMLNEGVAPRDAEGGPDLAKGTEVLTLRRRTGAYRSYTAVSSPRERIRLDVRRPYRPALPQAQRAR
jgi:hypothetical protein